MVLTILKKIPWWGWIAGIVAIIFLWQSLSGWAYSKKLYNMALDQLREDQSDIIKAKDEWIASCEQEIQNLQRKVEANQRQQATLRAENEKLKGRIHELEIAQANINVPTDPDALVDDLRKHGLGSAHRRKR